MIKFLLQPVIFDGVIYAGIAGFQFLNTEFASDEAAKYIHPMTLFYLKCTVGFIAATLLALKLYRSTTFAEYRQAKNGNYHTGDTQTFVKQNEIKTNVTA